MIMERHEANNDFVGQSTTLQHEEMIDGNHAEHLSIFDIKNELVGFILLIHHPESVIEFKRIVIDKKGKGYGQFSIQKVKQYVFEKLNAKRLWLDVFDFNERAIHVYKKLGFKVVITKYGSIIFKNEKRNQIIMDITRKEYLKTT